MNTQIEKELIRMASFLCVGATVDQKEDIQAHVEWWREGMLTDYGFVRALSNITGWIPKRGNLPEGMKHREEWQE